MNWLYHHHLIFWNKVVVFHFLKYRSVGYRSWFSSHTRENTSHECGVCSMLYIIHPILYTSNLDGSITLKNGQKLSFTCKKWHEIIITYLTEFIGICSPHKTNGDILLPQYLLLFHYMFWFHWTVFRWIVNTHCQKKIVKIEKYCECCSWCKRKFYY